MTELRPVRTADRWGRFPYALAWPAGLYYALVFGGSVTACLREGADPFGWAMSALVAASVLAAPITLVVALAALGIATRMKPEPGHWRRRFAWLGGAVAVVVLLGLLSGGSGERCHVDFM